MVSGGDATMGQQLGGCPIAAIAGVGLIMRPEMTADVALA